MHSQTWYLWTFLMWASSFGLWSENTKWGAALSSPLVTMLITITACNIGVLPTASPVYTCVNKYLVPLAVPLLLYDADLKRVMKYSGTLMACFMLGAVGTVLGTVVAAKLVPLGMGADGWKIAAALASRHIGGAVNYVAVAETLSMSAEAVVAGLAADNLVVALYFAFLFYMAKGDAGTAAGGGDAPETPSGGGGEGDMGPPTVDPASPLVGKDGLAYALAAGCALTFAGNAIAAGPLRGAISGIPITSLLTVAAASAFPKVLAPLGVAGAQVGVLFMQLFFAVTGASGSIAVVMRTAPTLLAFSAIQIAAHYAFTVGAGRALRLPFNQLLLASNANVGGPTTAAAFAASKRWSALVLPALLTGILGYAVATFVGIGLGQAVLRGMMGG
ncbi:hypothetical protein JKP88DRAFT_270683 [Tribonema minus]|uniref:DUF819 domain-containing protein n=1 Tax=Tribonema minus TaxID=303371 RepID=A0A835YW30_9STRA|nr:hypothetical protein JKP88DRAFT_270683 [Tribonema minus]